MKGDPLNPADWLRVAMVDLDRARREIRAADFTAAGFWLQQSAEKAMKGWLIGHGWSLVKTHELPRLAHECAGHGTDLAWFGQSARRLIAIYFTDRYVDDSPDPEPDATECSQLLADVENLHAILFPPPPAA